MEADDYVVEYLIRQRLIDVRAKARVAALLHETHGAQRPTAARTRLRDVRSWIRTGMQKAVGEIVHALPGQARSAKHWS